ncbi:MAG: DUF456 domain-containing protein [Planctomycetota bacterium]
MSLLLALVLVVILLGCWLVTLLGLPGNWLMVMATAIYAYTIPAQSPAALGWRTVVAILVLATLGEIVELLASTMGVSKTGGSRRGAVMALLGSIVGCILGTLIGVPIPLVGSAIAAVFFAGLGAMAGAMLGEISVGQRLGTSWQIGKAAFWGRLAGTMGKMLVGAFMIVFVVVAMLL